MYGPQTYLGAVADVAFGRAVAGREVQVHGLVAREGAQLLHEGGALRLDFEVRLWVGWLDVVCDFADGGRWALTERTMEPRRDSRLVQMSFSMVLRALL